MRSGNCSKFFSNSGVTKEGSQRPSQWPPEDYFSYFFPGAKDYEKGTKEKARCLGNLISIFKVIDEYKYPAVSLLEVDENTGKDVKKEHEKINIETLIECISLLIPGPDGDEDEDIEFFRSLSESLSSVARIINCVRVKNCPAVLTMLSSDKIDLDRVLLVFFSLQVFLYVYLIYVY